MASKDRWSASLLARESVRNCLGPGARLSALVVISVLLGALAATALAWSARDYQTRVEELRTQGRGVLVATGLGPESTTEISRSSCEALAGRDGVFRAGVVVAAGSRNFLQLGPQVPVVLASASLFPPLAALDAVIGPTLAEQAGLGPPGTRLVLADDDGSVAQAVVGEAQPAGVDTNYAVIYLAGPSTSTTERCVALLDHRASSDGAAELLGAQLRASGGAVSVTQVLQESIPAAELYAQRPERFLPVVLGLLGAVSAWIMTRLRSSELAVYRLSGTSVRSLALVVTLEQWLIAGAFAASGAAASLLLAPWAPFPAPGAAIGWVALGALAWAAAGPLGAAPILVRRPTDLAKDR